MTSVRKVVISLFVCLWILLFTYESVRYFYLEPIVGRVLPKVKFLFPPAGWIMFYNIDDRYAGAQVYGRSNGVLQRIDAHEVLRTRHFGYDNVQRNVLSVVLEPGEQAPFCAFLRRKFPEFDDFAINLVYYPSLTQSPRRREEATAYTCGPREGRRQQP